MSRVASIHLQLCSGESALSCMGSGSLPKWRMLFRRPVASVRGSDQVRAWARGVQGGRQPHWRARFGRAGRHVVARCKASGERVGAWLSAVAEVERGHVLDKVQSTISLIRRGLQAHANGGCRPP